MQLGVVNVSNKEMNNLWPEKKMGAGGGGAQDPFFFIKKLKFLFLKKII